MIAKGDLKGGHAGDWLVTGWFTEDSTYRPLAERFATNLTQHGAPFHLFAKPAAAGWSTHRKPTVVMEAMDLYPGKTLILADVDCLVRGDLEPATNVRGDVGITVVVRNMRQRRRWAYWLSVECSSRVVVFRPTEGARAFAQAWGDTIERSVVGHDEHAMAWAYLSSPRVRFDYIDQAYSGRETGTIPGAIIEHSSAHDEQRRAARGPFRAALRAFERRFLRRGLTRSSRLKGEMSVILKAS
jgi:hypothetical protein